MASLTGLPERSYSMPTAATNVVGPVARIAQQKKSNWCWAAVTASIVASKSVQPTPAYTDQGELAFATYSFSYVPPSHTDCCTNNSNDVCNGALPPERIAGRVAGVPSPLTIAGIAAQPPALTDNTIDDRAILGALRAQKPICIVINWSGVAQFHFVAIVGAATVGNNQQYLVADPIDGSANWFDRPGLNAYHSHAGTGGTWGDTYVTI